MNKILLFGGTAEGRILAEYFARQQVETCVCVATGYGEQLIPESRFIHSAAARLGEEEMEAFIRNSHFELLVDATHPYAREVSKNLKKACTKTGLTYLRVLRESLAGQEKEGVWVPDTEAAVEFLQKTSGNILVTTGSKELKKFTHLKDYKDRCYVRVLSVPEAAEECAQYGFTGKHLICMQGPFSKELNLAMLHQMKASYLVTKESGRAGGFGEKMEAAREAGAVPVVIGRPMEEEGYPLQEAILYLQKRYGLSSEKRRITLVGIGMGNICQLTQEAREALENCQIIIGASRVLESLKSFGKETFETIKTEEIVEFLTAHPQYTRVAAAFSGDVGFYSGAKRLLPFLKEFEVTMACGISSPVYFLNKLGIPWENAKLLSLHGKSCDWISQVWTNPVVFLLLGGGDTVPELCGLLCEANLSHVRLTVGENLSYETERITTGTPEELLNREFDKLAVLVVENPRPKEGWGFAGIPDESFARDKVPMTKSEVRSISIAKLRLTSHARMADIGAGTGSVSVEAARLAREGEVYAIEKKKEALCLLKENKGRFSAFNLSILEGEASALIPCLPKLSHAFIGGTGGHMEEILCRLLENNGAMRIVINVIALETLAELMLLLKRLPVTEVEIVQAGIAKGRKAGQLHLMMGQNPVYIISFTGNLQEGERDAGI